MEKTITIGGKDILLKSTGATAIKYKSQFQRDYFQDVDKLLAPKPDDPFEAEIIFNMAWILAKTADPQLKEMESWLEEFDEFPIYDVLSDIGPLIISTIKSTKKK